MINGTPIDAVAYFTQDRATPKDFESLNKATINSTGEFSTKFSGIPNKKTYIYILKKGYIPVREKFILNDPKEIKKLDPIYFSDLATPQPLKFAKTPGQQVVVYTDTCLKKKQNKNYPIEAIEFLEEIRPVTCVESGQRSGFQARLYIGGELSDSFIFGLGF